MSPRRTSKNNVEIRGPVALLFLLVVMGIYFYEEWQNQGAPLPTGPAADTTSTSAPPSGHIPTLPPVPGGIAVYFSNPTAPDADNEQGGPETHLINAILNARQTIDIAIYNLTEPAISDALFKAHQRGVKIRIVMESDAMDKQEPQRLASAGIPIIGDQREALMHNKFAIIDGQQVWTGSMNYTTASAYHDYNNLLRLDSTKIAQDYEDEFNQMFIEGLFGPKKRSSTPYTTVDLGGGVTVEVYFSPEDGVDQHVVAAIQNASTSVHFMAYSFTSDPIGEAMRAQAENGVEVRGVFDEAQYKSNKGGEFDPFQQAGLPVRLDGISGLLHDKVIIVDSQTVITGSYNFSASAENNNDENLLIIHSPAVAAQYEQSFEQIYAEAQP